MLQFLSKMKKPMSVTLGKKFQKQFKNLKQPKWLPPWQGVKKVKRRNGPKVKWQKKKKMLQFLSKMKKPMSVTLGKKFKKQFKNLKQPKWLPPWQVVKKVKRRNGPKVKWQKKKENASIFVKDEETNVCDAWQKIQKEVPKQAKITIASLQEKYMIKGSLARSVLRDLEQKKKIRKVICGGGFKLYTKAD